MKAYFFSARLYILFFLMALGACQPTPAPSTDTVTSVKITDTTDIASIVRNPVTADKPLDTSQVAKIVFDHTEHNFGTVTEGTVVRHSYSFKNTGQVPLIISDARSTCGCTVPEWPKNPILPGESGKIAVQFKTQGKENEQDKPVTIFANTLPNTSEVRLKGFVKKGRATAKSKATTSRKAKKSSRQQRARH